MCVCVCVCVWRGGGGGGGRVGGEDLKNVLLASGLSYNFTRSVRHFVSFAILPSSSGKISLHIFKYYLLK